MAQDKYDQIRRRRFLQSTAVTGALSGFAAFGGNAIGEGEDMVEYVKYLEGMPPNREKIYSSVPAEHWAVRFTADDLKDRVYEMIHSTWGEDSGLQVQWGPMKESPTGFGVEVVYSVNHNNDGIRRPDPSIEEIRQELPSTGAGTSEQDGYVFRREGIPITIVKNHVYPAGCVGEGDICQATDSDYYGSNLPGGVPVGNWSTGGGLSTLAAPFKETGDGYGKGWIGSGHAIKTGEYMAYPNPDDGVIGKCKKYNNDSLNDIEWSFIDATSDESPDPRIANGSADGTYEYNIKGIITDQGLKNDVDSGAWYYSNGRSTCRTISSLKKVGGFGSSYVTYYHDIEEGDSGGPLFTVIDNAAYIGAKHTAEIQIGSDEDSDSCPDDGKGTTAETIENKVPGNFLTT